MLKSYTNLFGNLYRRPRPEPGKVKKTLEGGAKGSFFYLPWFRRPRQLGLGLLYRISNRFV